MQLRDAFVAAPMGADPAVLKHPSSYFNTQITNCARRGDSDGAKATHPTQFDPTMRVPPHPISIPYQSTGLSPTREGLRDQSFPIQKSSSFVQQGTILSVVALPFA